jgi:hypothetical protein
MEIGLRDGTQSDATHEVPIASRDEKIPCRGSNSSTLRCVLSPSPP